MIIEVCTSEIIWKTKDAFLGEYKLKIHHSSSYTTASNIRFAQEYHVPSQLPPKVQKSTNFSAALFDFSIQLFPSLIINHFPPSSPPPPPPRSSGKKVKGHHPEHHLSVQPAL